MKTYEIKHEPVTLQDGTVKNKWNIYYYDESGELEHKELYAQGTINDVVGEILPGYQQVISIENINSYKEFLYNVIDDHSQTAILQGFTYNGKVFSMSVNAQTNWSNIPNIPDQFFPLTLSTKDNDVYQLSLAEKQTFYLTALGFKYNTLQAGTEKKQLVRNATTIEELQIIESNL